MWKSHSPIDMVVVVVVDIVIQRPSTLSPTTDLWRFDLTGPPDPSLRTHPLRHSLRPPMSLLRAPIFGGALPASTPGPHKDIGYAYIRSNVLAPHTVPWPHNKLTGQPALNIEEVGYAVFYPCSKDQGGSNGVTWFPDPADEMVRGYDRFLGKKGFSWLCECSVIVP